MHFWVRAEFARPLTQGVDKFVVGELFDNQSKTPGGIIVANDDRVGGNHACMAAMRPRRGAKAYPSPLERFRSRCRGARLWVCGPKAPTTVVVATAYNDSLVSCDGTI